MTRSHGQVDMGDIMNVVKRLHIAEYLAVVEPDNLRLPVVKQLEYDSDTLVIVESIKEYPNEVMLAGDGSAWIRKEGSWLRLA